MKKILNKKTRIIIFLIVISVVLLGVSFPIFQHMHKIAIEKEEKQCILNFISTQYTEFGLDDINIEKIEKDNYDCIKCYVSSNEFNSSSDEEKFNTLVGLEIGTLITDKSKKISFPEASKFSTYALTTHSNEHGTNIDFIDFIFLKDGREYSIGIYNDKVDLVASHRTIISLDNQLSQKYLTIINHNLNINDNFNNKEQVVTCNQCGGDGRTHDWTDFGRKCVKCDGKGHLFITVE